MNHVRQPGGSHISHAHVACPSLALKHADEKGDAEAAPSVEQPPASHVSLRRVFQRRPHLLSFAQWERVWPSGFHIAARMEGERAETVTEKLAFVLHTVVREAGSQRTHFSGH